MSAARLFLPLAVLLAAAGQVAAMPGMCCVVRQAVSADAPACCRATPVAVKPAAGHCPACRLKTAQADVPEVVSDHAPGGAPESCRWCVADPRTHASDRAAAPAPDDTALVFALPAVEPQAFVPAAVPALALPPLIHRTAVAMCAWLCVWRK